MEAQAGEGSGTHNLLNPELVILGIKEESNIENGSNVKEEPDVKEEIPSSDGISNNLLVDIKEESNEDESNVKEEPGVKDEEKVAIKYESGFKHTEHLDDCQTLKEEEEIILIKSESCNCAESCDCAKSEPLLYNDGETMNVENIEPLLTQNLAENLGLNRLKKSISFHTDNKYFCCDVCDYKCLPQANMEYHLRKHTGEKPLACGYCDYRASHPTTLKRHVRSQHTEVVPTKKVPPTKKVTKEKWREYYLKRKERIKNDPVLSTLEAEKERKKSERKKKRMKSIHEMSDREKRIQRKVWRQSAKKSYEKKKLKQSVQHYLDDRSHPPSEAGIPLVDQPAPAVVDGRINSGPKKLKEVRSKWDRLYKIELEMNKKLKRENAKLRQRLSRLTKGSGAINILPEKW